MILWIIDKIRIALTFSKEKNIISNAHIVLKIVSAMIFFAVAITTRDIVDALILLSYPIILTYLAKKVRILFESLQAIILPVSLLFFFTWLLSPEGPLSTYSIIRAATISLRISALALTLLIIFSFTNPVSLSAFLEKCGLPLTLTQSIILTWRLIPLVLKDFLESLASLKLRKYPTWKTLIPLTVVSMEKALRTSETLYVKGFGWSKKRTYITPLGNVKNGLVMLGSAILISLTLFIL